MKYLSLLFLLSSLVFAQKSYFYTGKDYGSEAVYNPINLILNGSYDIIQLDGHSRKIFDFPYERASRNIFNNLKHPFKAINEVGWWKFISTEVVPLNVARKGAQWWPNYQLHLIGGGMSYAAIKEWYEYHNFPSPTLLSLTTIASYHLLNELVENEGYIGTNTDPIADIYLFDLGGVILFSFDNVKKFFKEELNLADWSLQPSFQFTRNELHNNGQYFSVKWKVPFWENEKWHLFYYFGMNGLGGLSYKYNDEESLSAGIGLRAKNLNMVDAAGRQLTIDMVWNVGLFYDKNNSLMTSLFISGLTDYSVNLNVYPGIIKMGNFSPGFWTVIQKNGNVLFGISTIYLPGISLSTK